MGFGSAKLWLIAAFDYAFLKGLEKSEGEIQRKLIKLHSHTENKRKQCAGIGTLFMSQQKWL